jgi:GMP synthase (glutamine-hydrolysing)
MTRRNFRRELDADIVEFHTPSGEIPEGFGYDGFVVTGSAASVYWEREWIDRLKSWVGETIDAGVPALGVCYGHQLLADVMGGTVEDMGEYEIGYRTVKHDGENDLLAGVNEEMTVFTSHSDRVAEKPPGATVFAENDYGIHGFRKGDVFGVQFHPEYDIRTAETVAKSKEGDLSQERIDTVLRGVNEKNYREAYEAKRLFDNFLAYTEKRQPTRVAAD